jgi:CheY-like chemotaxis protein
VPSTSAPSDDILVALVVEPEAGLRNRLIKALEAYSIEVISAGSSREALALLDLHPVRALVIDAQLPSTSGFDLVRSVRQHPRGARAAVIIVTSVRWTPFQKAAALHQMGLLDLLVKPVDPSHVAELLVGALTSEPPAGSWGRESLVEEPPDRLHDTMVGGGAPPLFPPEHELGSGGALEDRPEDTRVDSRDADLPEGDTQVEANGVAARMAAKAGDDATEIGPPPLDPRQLADPASHSEKRQVERATRAARAGPVELRGNLTRTPFPQLMHNLYQRRATGALFLLADRVKKIVYFKEGHPSYIKSNRLSECLGKVLVREGMITEGQCRESLRRMAETTRQQGTVLIEMGVISPHDLVVGLELQLRIKLMDIFSWARGEYLFRRESRVPSDVITLEVSSASLVADGVRAAWDEERLSAALTPYLDRYPTPNANPEMRFQEIVLDPEEQNLLDHIDGSRTLRQILADSALTGRKAKAVAYVLLVTDVIEPREAPSAPQPEQDMQAQLPPQHEEEESLRQRLAAELLSLRQRDAFGVLGLRAGCSDREAREAHGRAARDFHPDRYRHLSGETRRLAQELFHIVNAAFERISTAALREQYRRDGMQRPTDGEGTAGEVALEAEEARQRAKQLMRRQAWAEARQLLTLAVSLCPDAGDLRALLAWSTYRSDTESASMVRSAIRELRQAIELNPRHHEAYLFLGRIYAGMGKTILAEKQFEKALQCNPDCQEALDELKIQKERRPPRRFRL